jgi:aspartate racemase
MGPMAGVLLQKLIIENTPAEKDQDHVQVVCFTDPQIPDRTEFIKKGKTNELISAIAESIKVLENAGVDMVAMTCNTAHVCFKEIQEAVSIPILNLIENTFEKLRESGISSVGILATDGTINSGVFSDKNIKVIVPAENDQKQIMDIIYKEIKAGNYNNPKVALQIDTLIQKLKADGAEAVILGCTELSLYYSLIKEDKVFDPMDLLAKKVVELSKLEYMK